MKWRMNQLLHFTFKREVTSSSKSGLGASISPNLPLRRRENIAAEGLIANEPDKTGFNLYYTLPPNLRVTVKVHTGTE